MKWNQWVGIVFFCAATYLISKFLPAPDGAVWFSYQALWSTAAIFVILKISNAKLAIFLALLEFSLIITNTIAYTGYMAGGGLFYAYCLEITDAVHLVEVFALVTGAPWDGLANRFKQLGLVHFLCNKDQFRRLPRHYRGY